MATVGTFTLLFCSIMASSFLPPQPNPHDHLALAWSDGALLTSACVAAGQEVASPVDPWRAAALRQLASVRAEWRRCACGVQL